MAGKLVLVTVLVLVLGYVAFSGDTIHLSDVTIEGSSQQPTCEYIYFRVPEDTECAGIRIRRDGQIRYLSFVEGGEDADVDSRATMPNDYAWEGMLRVEIPTDPEIREHGGEITVRFEGGGRAQSGWTSGYSSREEVEALRKAAAAAKNSGED
jgi:hypothetical protein